MTAAVSQPMTRAIAPSKQGARRHYGSHPYFTKRAWNVVQAYISHFTSPGDTVLDPFGGSGVTATESLVLQRKAVYVDISRWASFLARQTALAPVNLASVQHAFEQVTQRCRERIVRLWSRPEKELAAEPVAEWYPRRAALPSNADVPWVEDLFTPRMLHGLALLRAAIMEVEDVQSRDLLLMAFSATLVRINRTFLSANNRAESRGGSAVFSIYRYKVADRVVELPLWEQFEKRVERLLDAKRETNQLIGDFYREGNTAVFHYGSATRLGEWLNPDSVDYIYTDPPYGAHIAYLDLSTMWATWLDMQPTVVDREEEVIEGGECRKTREGYHHLLSQSISQMFEVLKTGGWMSLVFAHRDTAYWQALVDACTTAGFEYVNTVVQPVGVVWSMHKKKNPLRVLSGELVLNFRKVRRRSSKAPSRQRGEAVDLVRRVCEAAVVAGAGATTEDLHNIVIPRLLEWGSLAEFSRQLGDITPLLEKWFHFDHRSGRWFMPSDWTPGPRVKRAEAARYLTILFLSECAKAGRAPTEYQVQRHISARLNGCGPIGRNTVRKILQEIAYTPDDLHWQLSSPKGQREFAFA